MNAALGALTAVVAVTLAGAWFRPATARMRIARRSWSSMSSMSRPWRRQRPGPTDIDVAAWCQRVAHSSRAGSSLVQAIAEADAETPADRRPFPGAGHALQRGRGLADALAPTELDPSTPAGVVGPVIEACADLGGPPAAPLERVSDVLLARAAEQDERRAATAQARLSAGVLTAVPLGIVAFLVLSEPAIRAVLATPAGATCLVAGVVINLLGRWWMSVLIRSSP
jgi:tight adherence protein B